jgi:hypothetical protein
MTSDALRYHDADSGTERRDVLTWSVSVAAHVAVVATLILLHAAPPQPGVQSINIGFVELPEPDLPAPPAPAETPPVQAVVAQEVVRATPRQQEANDAEDAPVVDTFSDVLTESQITGAVNASNGETGSGAGGACDMARILQQALQREPRVNVAVGNANRLGKSIILWNGDWVRSGTQDGKGLSGVRELIMWEVAFAPEACRNARVQGLVLFSLADGVTRFAIGSGDWRWSDLLGLSR